MNIIIATPMLKQYSAVGNDVEAMYGIMRSDSAVLPQKSVCKVYAEHKFSDNVEYASKRELNKLLVDENSLLIYHHSVYWEEGKHFLKKAKCKIVFRYHNITPPSFYERYNELFDYACRRGREQTKELIKNHPNALWLCNSPYSASELTSSVNTYVCPPFNLTEQWTKATPNSSLKIPDSCINLLFVGRVTPNKGHLFLLDILSRYVNNFDKKIKLRIVGDLDVSLIGYSQEIKHNIKVSNLEDNVEFIGEIDDSALLAYYKGSDFFISASEHEGFMVPIAEAQYLGLPIIARAKAAVPDTLGENQLLLGDDPTEYAAAIHLVHNNREYRDFLVDAGYKNFRERYTNAKITETFTDFLKVII